MAKAPGRNAKVYKNAILIGGVRVTNISIDSTPIDVTDNDSAGLQELLPESSMRVLSFDIEGVYKDPVLRDIALDPDASQLLTDMTFKVGDAFIAKTDFGTSLITITGVDTKSKDATKDVSSIIVSRVITEDFK